MLQNRVDPRGAIIRTEARGTLMGNRGVIHDVNKNIVRPFKHKAWITCAIQFKGRHRTVMSPNRWTELFFLDEATAFAAGHRPCCECRRVNFNEFKLCWINGNPEYGFEPTISIGKIDEIIHEERVCKDSSKRTYDNNDWNLPDGTFIERSGEPFLVAGDFLYRWSPFGYALGIPLLKTESLHVLTPTSIVNAFRAGYGPRFALLK